MLHGNTEMGGNIPERTKKDRKGTGKHRKDYERTGMEAGKDRNEGGKCTGMGENMLNLFSRVAKKGR